MSNFVRNYDADYRGLKITYLSSKPKQEKGQPDSQKSITTTSINYMKMLRNHKMQEKI